MSSIIYDPIWAELRPYVQLQDAGGHNRIEIKGMPSPLASRALAYSRPCVDCGAPMHLVRQRYTKTKRGHVPSGAMYVGVSCEEGWRGSCSKGGKASAAYREIREDVERYRRGHPTETAAEAQMQLGLVG